MNIIIYIILDYEFFYKLIDSSSDINKHSILEHDLFNTIVGAMLSALVTFLAIYITFKVEEKNRRKEEIDKNQPILDIQVTGTVDKQKNSKQIILKYQPFGLKLDSTRMVDTKYLNSVCYIQLNIHNISSVPCYYLNVANCRIKGVKGEVICRASATHLTPDKNINFELPLYHPNIKPENTDLEEIPMNYTVIVQLIYGDKNGITWMQDVKIFMSHNKKHDYELSGSQYTLNVQGEEVEFPKVIPNENVLESLASRYYFLQQRQASKQKRLHKIKEKIRKIVQREKK